MVICTQVQRQLTAISATSRVDAAKVLKDVQEIVHGMLGSDIGSDQPLMEAGLDSLGAVELRTSLGNHFGTELPATITFDHPSIDALAKFLAGFVSQKVRKFSLAFSGLFICRTICSVSCCCI